MNDPPKMVHRSTIPVTDRLDWLSSKVNDAMTKDIAIKDVMRMNDIIDLLS